MTLTRSSMQHLLSKPVHDLWAYGRPFMDTDGPERKLDAFPRKSGLQWPVPDGEGPWFVYAKVDGVTRSRPLHVNRSLSSETKPSPFFCAVTTINRHEREAMIRALLRSIGDGSESEARKLIIDLFGNLDPALPPQAFDVFRLLPFARDLHGDLCKRRIAWQHSRLGRKRPSE